MFGKKKKVDPKAQQTPAAPPLMKGIQTLERGMVSLSDIIAPSSIEVDFRFIRVGEKYYTTLFMVGYPRYVSASWLQPIIDYDHTMDIGMFAYPTSSSNVLDDLKRKIAEMEATIDSEQQAGHIVDPKVQAALEDALSLQEELAKGVERFFQFSFYITISAATTTELFDATRQLQTTLASLLLTGKTATLQMEEGFKSTLPIGQDRLFITRNMDTTSLASTFPFTSAILTQNKGVMYGMNQQNGSLIIFDRFSLENANEVVLGKSGAGKSYLIKLEIMRQFMLGAEVIVIDPEGEYGTLARALGGEVVSFTPSSPIKINPFDLSDIYEEGENQLGLKILSLHGLLKIIVGDTDAEHDAILDNALVETYRQKGITPDPATQSKPAPLMEDLYKTLLGMENAAAKDLAFRMEKFIKGSAAGIFNQPSNFDIKSPLTIFGIKQLEEELRPIAMHIILDYVWNTVKKTLKKRVLVLDEAWYMMKYQDSASFVYSIAKRARKYYLGMTTATQDVEDFLSTDYGKAVLTNSSIQMLLKQGTAEVEMVSNTFFLSEGEKELLMSADVGEGLFFAGQNHVAMKVLGAPFEHDLITSNPEELLKQQAAAAQPTVAPVPAQQLDTNISQFLNQFQTPQPATPPKGEPAASVIPQQPAPPPQQQPTPPVIEQPANPPVQPPVPPAFIQPAPQPAPQPIIEQTPAQPPMPTQPPLPQQPTPIVQPPVVPIQPPLPASPQPQPMPNPAPSNINHAIEPPPPPYQQPAQPSSGFTTAGIPGTQPPQPQVP